MPKPEQLPDSLIDQIVKALEEARRIEAERAQAERLRHAEEERYRVEKDRQEAATRRAEEAEARKRFQEEQARRAEEIAQEARLAREARYAGELKQNSRNKRLGWRRLRITRSGGASINPRSRRLLRVKADYQGRTTAVAVGLLWLIVASLALNGAVYDIVHARWPNLYKTEIDITVWASVIVITILWLLYFLSRER
jgi:hypothetical protein